MAIRHDITDTANMSENILVDGKPLHLLRVVDLREELKKRGIKASGTKPHLQELLKSAILSAQDTKETLEDNNNAVEKSKTDKDSQEENSNESSDNNSASEEKVASISINEATESIKLTIRSSPRKSEPTIPDKDDSETESSQSESDSNVSPKTQDEENICDKTDSPNNHTDNDDGISTSDSITKESSRPDSFSKEAIIPEVIRDDATARPDGINHDDQGEKPKQNSNETTVDYRSNDKEESVVIAKPSESVLESLTSVQISEPSEKFTESNDEASKKTKSNQELVFHTEVVAVEESNSEPAIHVSTRSTRGKSLSQPKPAKGNTSKPDESPPEQESKSKPSIRGRLLSHSKSINEEEASKPIQKKRRWGSSHTSEASVLNKGISSDKLKQLISESVQVIENDSSDKVSRVVDEDESVQSTVELTNNEPETKEEVKIVDLSNNKSDDDENSNKKSINNEKLDQVGQEEEENVPPSVSPAKNPESTVLFVTGLVRPYTLPQLKKLLSAAGHIDEEKFWIDKIKSKCYVVYSTTEEAIKTRESLHNLKWPTSSPKNLAVEFATLEDIDRCLHPENYEDLPLKGKPTNDNTTTKVEKKEPAIEISKGKYDIILNEPIRDTKAQAKNANKDDASGRNIREWDRNKVNLTNRKENEEDKNRKRPRLSPQPNPEKKEKEKIRERSKSPEVKRKKNENEKALRESNKKSESPAKMLEDLFRKTKAPPYIYWLPLTDEQVVEKQKQIAVAEKERQTRIAARRDNKRESSPPNRPPVPTFHNLPHERPKFQDLRPRRSPSPPRRKRSLSRSPRRYSRYSRSRSPEHRRFSPRRRR